MNNKFIKENICVTLDLNNPHRFIITYGWESLSFPLADLNDVIKLLQLFKKQLNKGKKTLKNRDK